MRLESITSLRFFAALMVLFSHFGFLSESELGFVRELYNRVFWEGYIGVTFFFILSGFILCHAYTDRLITGKVGFYEYLAARIARIYPLHLLTLLASIPLTFLLISNASHSILPYLSNATLVQSFCPERSIHFAANIPSWTLSNEMFFYLLFPFFVRAKSQTLLWVVALAVLFQLGVAFSELAEQRKHYFNYIFPPARLLDFCVGILAYRVYRRSLNAFGDRQVNVFQVGSILLLIVMFALKGFVPQAYRYDLYYVLGMALMIYAFALPKGVLSSLLQHRYLIVLGESSFSLYLIHWLVFRYAEEVGKMFGYKLDYLSAIGLLLISIVLSLLCYHGLERRAHRYSFTLLKPIARKLDGNQ